MLTDVSPRGGAGIDGDNNTALEFECERGGAVEGRWETARWYSGISVQVITRAFGEGECRSRFCSI